MLHVDSNLLCTLYDINTVHLKTSYRKLLCLEAHFWNGVLWLQVTNLLSLVSVENKNKPSAVFVNWCELMVGYSKLLPCFFFFGCIAYMVLQLCSKFPRSSSKQFARKKKRLLCRLLLDVNLFSALLLSVSEASVRYPLLITQLQLGSVMLGWVLWMEHLYIWQMGAPASG